VILATDGDFNVGVSSVGGITRLIERKRKSGIQLSVLGFGMGNLDDATMETLADKGDGNYAYIDTLHEARKVLVEEAGSTLVTIAKDVKIQVEFNPGQVESYRLLGYENRKLQDRDFEDDTKDAGEIGAGHTVTALYEIVPAKARKQGRELRYQTRRRMKSGPHGDELLHVKLRYKPPTGGKSRPLSIPVRDRGHGLQGVSDEFRFAAAVAELGLLLRDSRHKAKASFAEVVQLARSGKGRDPHGYRAEFIDLARHAEALSDRDDER
jgi:Ca-activated chloride channel family protein